jgi:signal transduction histidine kinase
LTEEIRERLFLPYYSTKHRGTGLGLSIAAKIVQEHGGTINAEANTPKGARFMLRLPVVESSAEPVPASNGGQATKRLAS